MWRFPPPLSGPLGGEGTIAGGLTLGAGLIASNLATDPTTPGTLTVGGMLTVNNTANVSFTSAPTAAGTYAVIKHGGTTATPTNFALPNYRNPVFDTTTDPTTVTVHFDTKNITWTGSTSAVWDLATTSNFVSPGPVAEKFYSVDAVTFDDTATNFNPTLAVTVLPSSVTFNNTTAYTLTGAGVIGGNGPLTKSGTGSVTLSTPNTFTGNIAINGGKLVTGNAASLGAVGAKTITIASGAQLDFAGISPGTTRLYTYKVAGTGDGTGALVNSSTTSLGGNSGVVNLELTADASIGGAGRFDVGNAGTGITTGNGHVLTKVGAGQVQLRGDASGSAITIQVQGGTLGAENVDTAFGGASGSVSVANGATVATYGVRSIATPVTLAAGATLSNLGGGAGAWTGSLTVNGDASISPAGQTINLNGVISGTSSLSVLPTGGTLNLNNTANTITGGWLIGANAPTGDSATTVNVPTGVALSVASGKLVQIGNNVGSGGTSTKTLSVTGTVNNAGSLFAGRSGTLTINSGGAWNQSGPMAINSQGGYLANLNVNAGSTFTYSGSSSVKVNGGSTGVGTITISGLFVTSAGFEQDIVPATTYGTVNLVGGTIKLTADVAQLTAVNRLTLGTGGGTIDTNGFNASASYAVTGTTAFTKAGAGRLTLTGASTYSGATTVTGGTLAGAGSTASAVTANSGTHIAPGNVVGNFNCAGLTLSSGSTLDIEISSSTATADKVVSTANVNITGADVSFSEVSSAALATGTKLVILDYTGKTLTGTFNGLANGATVTVGANSYTLNYNDTSRITLTSQAAAGYAGWATTNAGGQAANLDYDNDGVPNGVEYLMGQTGSGFTANPAIVNGKVTWPKDPAAVATWVVEVSSNLTSWTTATSGVVDLGTSIEYTVPTGDTKRFARLRVTAP
ncbi:MAG: autotransporter-associated beta strand repeat-containing protein [Luteolibacter sp.]